MTGKAVDEGADRAAGSPPPALLADATVGKLARWLRLLGYDVAYDDASDKLAVAWRARSEGRVMLTRDRSLANRQGLDAVAVSAQDLDTQLGQVVREVGPPAHNVTPRCMACNVPLVPLSPEEARALVPPHVARTQREFSQCAACGKVYWSGTHWTEIKARIAEAFQDAQAGD